MLKDEFSFELEAQDDKARLGLIKTKRGIINTPAFMPVGTQGTVKGLFTDDILKTETDIILGNTYHLLLRPGIEVLKNFNYNYENYLIEKDEHTMSQETITLFQNFIKKNI